MDSYTLYYDNKKFVNQLKKVIEQKYNLTTRQVWSQSVTKDNKAEFMRVYQIMNERVKYYNYKINQYFDQRSSNSEKNFNKNQNKILGKHMQNADMKDKVEIVKNIFFKGQNRPREKLWLKYWQLFGLALLVLDNKLDVSIFDDLYEKYSYDIYQKVNKIMIKNFTSIVGSNYSSNVYPDFFNYLKNIYCGSSEQELMQKFSKVTQRAIHQLSSQEKNAITERCGVYPDDKNEILKSKCTKNMICSFIIYQQSKEQLKYPEYQIMATTIRNNILLYYITLVVIYSKIVNDLYQKANQKYEIFSTANDQKILNQIYNSPDLYRYQQ